MRTHVRQELVRREPDRGRRGSLLKLTALCAVTIMGVAGAASAGEITVATVNNSDMIIMQKLSTKWEQQTGNKINWNVLEENVLRQRLTTDIATKGGQYDVMTIGAYETPIWAKQGWLAKLDDLGADYDYGDLLAPVKAGLSYDGTLYAVPFYAESSMTWYRKDLFEQAGLTMPDQPTYDQIRQFADKLTDRSKDQNAGSAVRIPGSRRSSRPWRCHRRHRRSPSRDGRRLLCNDCRRPEMYTDNPGPSGG